MNPLLIAGYIDGTKTVLGLFQEKNHSPIGPYWFENSKEKKLALIVEDFLNQPVIKSKLESNAAPQKACFAVATRVNKEQNICELSNLEWTLDGNNLAKEMNIEQVNLISDSEAFGYGVLKFLQKPESRGGIELVQSPPQPKTETLIPLSPIGAISYGTSLGEAFILKKTREEITGTIYTTEASQSVFGLCSPEFLEYIMKSYDPPQVSVEQVVSDEGIVKIYKFLQEKDEKIKEEPGITAEKICKAALEQRDELCIKTMKMFAEAYGSEVGNFALKLLPYEGLYLGGNGMALKLFQDAELKEKFLKGFREKGRMATKVIEKIPLYLVRDPLVCLIGVGHYLEQSRNLYDENSQSLCQKTL